VRSRLLEPVRVRKLLYEMNVRGKSLPFPELLRVSAYATCIPGFLYATDGTRVNLNKLSTSAPFKGELSCCLTPNSS